MHTAAAAAGPASCWLVAAGFGRRPSLHRSPAAAAEEESREGEQDGIFLRPGGSVRGSSGRRASYLCRPGSVHEAMYAADRSLTANAFLPSACASWAGVVSRTAVALVAAENLHAAATAAEEEEEEEAGSSLHDFS